MISDEDVISAYRLLLGREPENQEAVRSAAAECSSLKDLRQRFINSTEFRKANGITNRIPFDAAPAAIDVNANPAELAMMVSRIGILFDHLGKIDPHWSVLSAEKYRADRIVETEGEFFASGEVDVRNFQATARRCSVSLNRDGECVELGCGLGRGTIWLSRIFSHVTAIDISAPHLEIASQAVAARGVRNIKFQQFDSLEVLDRLTPFDAFFCLLVLQHNPPPVMALMLRKILRRLKSGGLAYFQIPVFQPSYHFKPDEYIKNPSQLGQLEMHILPQRDLFRIIRETDCEVLEVREDGSAGPTFVSLRLLLVKN